MNTLHHLDTAHRTVTDHTTVAASTARLDASTSPPLLDRAAMRVGLWLLLWGRHRAHRRVERDAYTRYLLAEQVRHERERADAYGAFSLHAH